MSVRRASSCSSGFDAKYKMLGNEAIGVGGQAKAYLCKSLSDDEVYVVKEFDLRAFRMNKDAEKKIAQLQRELTIHINLSHPNIVRCIEYFDSKTRLQLILEYCSEGDVMDYIDRKPTKKLDEFDAKKIIKDVCLALQYLHGKSLLHRDIKPENILLSGTFDESGFPRCKVSDFGVSKELKDGTVGRTFTGSPIYMAPEITEAGGVYGYPADCWSVGITLYVMLFASFPPFEDDFVFLPQGKKWEALSLGVREIIAGLIVVDPEKRLTIDQILSSSWLNDL